MGGQPQSATVHKTSISPMLSVRNGAKAIEFYKRRLERLSCSASGTRMVWSHGCPWAERSFGWRTSLRKTGGGNAGTDGTLPNFPLPRTPSTDGNDR